MIESNIAEVLLVLNGMSARMADMRPVMQRIGEYQGSKILLELMEQKEDPEGHAWAAWMPSTRSEREAKGNASLGLLWDRGDLLHSIKVQPGLQSVVIGSNSKYAGFLQDGTKKMVARPFLGWSDEDIEYTGHLVAQYIEGLHE